MTDVDHHKSVFLNYRREPSRYLALAIFKELEKGGYSVFWDIEGIGSGKFGEIILQEITSRPHFVVLLTNNTLDRCIERGDWLRREIEYAMSMERNIIPIMVDGFEFKNAKAYMKGSLQKLSKYNGLPLYYQFFDAGIDKLCNQYLTNIGYGKIIPMSDEAAEETSQIIVNAINTPAPTQAELGAEQLYVRAVVKHKTGDLNGASDDYSEAIRLNPNYAYAYTDRGNLRAGKGDIEGAIRDYNRAISHKPDHAETYYNRGIARQDKHDLEGARDDFSAAIRLQPDYINAYFNRGLVRQMQGDFEGAIRDYSRAIRHKADHTNAFFNRGFARQMQDDLEGAIRDYSRAIRYKPDHTNAFFNRAELYFATNQYDKALADFKEVEILDPDYATLFASLAITHYALGNGDEAKQLWQGLVEQDVRYNDVEWVGKELNWKEPMIDAARKLISEL